jgi:hypothetical protein
MDQRRTPLTAGEIQDIRIGHAAVLDARRRAQARGLTEAQIEQEEADDASQFWADVAEASRELRAEARAAPRRRFAD